ncbi:uncharacterized protein LOC111643105 [Copidosoma floridanum]|uniref:uncharacterized protein LOC111643105 n=1 Tax=Copidosoma floridanum TaxID=29053 RepID=UPI000C6F80A4|nr:uncharacterized protein LOC111643105 [Copidosoma floridanum]
MTGLSSFDYLDFLESVVKEVLPNMEISLYQNSAQLSIKDRIGFESVRAVIDGIEISIQKPKKICCQVEAYSTYKSAYTMKFVTAVSQGGIITFVSKAYPGRCSDKAIFEKSKLIHKLDRDDSLITDKGFLIDDICLLHGIQLIRPPFLSDKKQFSKEEALLNAKIAKARVHIE